MIRRVVLNHLFVVSWSRPGGPPTTSVTRFSRRLFPAGFGCVPSHSIRTKSWPFASWGLLVNAIIVISQVYKEFFICRRVVQPGQRYSLSRSSSHSCWNQMTHQLVLQWMPPSLKVGQRGVTTCLHNAVLSFRCLGCRFLLPFSWFDHIFSSRVNHYYIIQTLNWLVLLGSSSAWRTVTIYIPFFLRFDLSIRSNCICSTTFDRSFNNHRRSIGNIYQSCRNLYKRRIGEGLFWYCPGQLLFVR